MNRSFKLAAAAFAVSALSASAASAASSVNAAASATIVSPVSIVENQPLSFGTFASSATAGQVAESGSANGGILVITPGQAASFTVTGQGNTVYTLTGPNSVTLSSAGAPSMNATIDTPWGARQFTNGTDTFQIHGILDVAANQPAGNYTGTYPLSVHY